MNQLTVEQINDIMDTKPQPVTVPGSEDAYASMMQQQAKREGHRGKAPRTMPRPQLDMGVKTNSVIAVLEEYGPLSQREFAEKLDIRKEMVYRYASQAIDFGLVEIINTRTPQARFRLVND